MVESRTDQDNLLKILAICGIAAPFLFTALVTAGGLIYEGYSHVTQTVSELGGVDAEFPLLQNTNFFVIGILFIAFAVGLRLGIGKGMESVVGPALIGVFGISSGLGNAVFHCDPGREFQTLTGTMHNLTGLGGFVAATTGMFVISRSLKRDPLWHSLYGFSRIVSIVAAVSLLMWIGIAKVAEVKVWTEYFNDSS